MQREATAAARRPEATLPVREAESFDEAEKAIIYNKLVQCGGNIRKTADCLGISRRTIYRKLEKYDIDPDRLRR